MSINNKNFHTAKDFIFLCIRKEESLMRNQHANNDLNVDEINKILHRFSELHDNKESKDHD